MPSVTRNVRAGHKTDRPSHADRKSAFELELLEAIERLMSEGYAFTELSVERLAIEAGSSRATFYVYFKDKTALLQQLAARVLSEVAESAQSWWQVAERQSRMDLRHGLERIVATYRRRQHILAAIIELASYDPGMSATYRELIQRNASSTSELIQRGQAAGQIRTMPTTEAAVALTLMVERTCYELLGNKSPEADTHVVDALAELIWGALYLEPFSAVSDTP